MLLRCLTSDVTQFLEHRDALMFNERDFQLQLALYLYRTGHYDGIDIEYAIPNAAAAAAGYEWESNLRLDMAVHSGSSYAVVELKYPTRRVRAEVSRFGRVLPDCEVIKSHGAQDLVSYHFWKDVRRIEIVRRLFPDTVVGGLAVMLTNDPCYVRGAADGTIYREFSTADRLRDIHGRLDWSRPAATATGHPGFTLEGRYSTHWHHTDIANEHFNYLIIQI